MIDSKRAELIGALARIGLVGSVKQGMFDVLFLEGEGASPDVLLRITELEELADKYEMQIGEVTVIAETGEIKISNLEQKTTAQASTLALHSSEITRLDTAIDANEASIVSMQNQVAELDTDVNALQTSNTSLTSRMTANEALDSTQNTRLDTLEDLVTGFAEGGLADIQEELDSKADLVGGKIPLSQLPELPTGRKVVVENDVERLSLSDHTDITIAYQEDDGLAYILGAGDDPSVAENWTVLGNTTGSGVTAFNGRTGVVSPQAGDYTTAMIAPSADRGYVTTNDRNRWDNKATPATVEASVSALRSEVAQNYVAGSNEDFLRTDDTTVVKRNELGVNSGIATLGSDGKVLSTQLPPLGLSAAQELRLSNVEELAELADQKGDLAAQNNSALDVRIQALEADSDQVDFVNDRVDAIEEQRVSDRALIDANTAKNTEQDTRLTTLENGSANGIPLTQKAAANGVATLNEDTKVPMEQLLTGVAGGIPILGADGKLPADSLPASAGGGTSRVWRNVKGSRTSGQYTTNNTDQEMRVYVKNNSANVIGKVISATVRQSSAGPSFAFRSDQLLSSGNQVNHMYLDVPAGWQYALTLSDSTTASIELWYEMSV